MERQMASYAINVVGNTVGPISPDTAGSATEALTKLRTARRLYRRVWVSDQEGNGVSEAVLMGLAEKELKNA